MKLHTVAALAVVVAAGGMGVSSDAWALGGGTLASCQLDSANSLGNAITGTVTATLTNAAGVNATVDAILRLQYGGKEKVFRAHVPLQLISSGEEILCGVLAANPTDASGATIQTAFGITTPLRINRRAIAGQSTLEPVPGAFPALSMAIAEVTIYP